MNCLIVVVLQPMKKEPPSDFKCKDKFLVQYFPVPKESILKLQNSPDMVCVASCFSHIQWSLADQERNDDVVIVDIRLKVNFVPPSLNVCA